MDKTLAYGEGAAKTVSDDVWAAAALGDRRGGKSDRGGRSPVEKLNKEEGGRRWRN